MPIYLDLSLPSESATMSVYEALSIAISFAMLILYIDRDKDKKR